MGTRRRTVALVASVAMTVVTGLAVVPSSGAAEVGGAAYAPRSACSAPPWAEGTSYQAGSQVRRFLPVVANPDEMGFACPDTRRTGCRRTSNAGISS
jgi:hypothetical protein